MAEARARTLADIRLDLEAAEQRLERLYAQWQAVGSTRRLPEGGAPTRELLAQVEEVLRNQRGTLDRLHQLWIEYAQLSGQHAPQ
jgi:hypothetical protein